MVKPNYPFVKRKKKVAHLITYLQHKIIKMKKIILFNVLFAFATITAVAQTNPVKKLASNLKSIDDLTKILADDFTMIENTGALVSSATFKMGECMVLTSFGDEGINKQAADFEKEFGGTFNNSSWAFSTSNNATIATVKVTAHGQTETSNYSPSGAIVNITTLIQGFQIKAYLYQNKKEKNNYLL
ncbi:MAG: hypothetical protein RIS73_160, partial [Bacteroidota bacterium]